MALYFSETVLAHAKGEAVGVTILGRFDFADGEMRLWMGEGPILLGGEQWDGLGQFASISSLASGAGDVAQPVTFTLSGIDEEIVQRAMSPASRAAIKGRRVTVYIQFFKAADGKPLDLPVSIWVGKMDRMTTSGDHQTRQVNLICEGLLSNRSKAASGLYTQTDQAARYPDDIGLEFVNALIFKAASWPTA